jgi:hypothetical protein
MAMLMTNSVFGGTWATHAGVAPTQDFWPEVIGALRAWHPDTVLIAEAYWDMEWDLQQQGFDFCYDKRLYDRLTVTDPSAVRQHVAADLSYQARLLRFLENHDEPRIAERLPEEAERAAAVAVATLPGATLWHEGQFEGRRVRPPVFLARRPDEVLRAELADWYRTLLSATARNGVRRGLWRLLAATGWPDNQSCRNLLTWSWNAADTSRHVVVINLSGQPAQGQIPLDWPDLPGRTWRFTDLLQTTAFDRDGTELASPGLFVDLPPWRCHLLALS